MNIIISDNLKEFRKKKGNTQEELAEFLMVSIAAVSKWERGECYPDIELLPRIAMFNDTTVDDLLGVGEARKGQKIGEYQQKNEEYWKKGDYAACVELWREAAKEFPNDEYVKFALMQALSNHTPHVSGPQLMQALAQPSEDGAGNAVKQKELLNEIVELGESIAADWKHRGFKDAAMYRLAIAYKDLGEPGKAKSAANKLPSMGFCRENTLLFALEGAELKTHWQEMQRRLFETLFYQGDLHRLEYSDEQIACILQKAIQLIKLLFEDGDFGGRHYHLFEWYSEIAAICTKKNDKKAVIENLGFAAEHAIAYDLLDENAMHTSILFNTLKTTRGRFSGWTYNESQRLLGSMAEPHFDFCREDEEFKEIVAKLETVAGPK